MNRFRTFFVRAVIPWILALIFGATGIWKLDDLRSFADHIGEFGIVDDSLLGVTAVALASLEIVTAIAILIKPRAGLALAALMLAVFSGVLAYGIARGFDVDCGCLPDPGIGLPRSLTFALGRNLVLLAAIGAAWRSGTRSAREDSPGRSSLAPSSRKRVPGEP